ncbi:MAG: hypothetical protein KDC28_01810 [Saprospiraceae bacterium]|nr:hypothetical protein [Saprospiraceae bacterium]MCB9319023.1 hypothetical protein [Lewinellaceae bacterium]
MKDLILLFIGILFTSAALAQTVQQNANGEWIVQFADGTWRYFEAGDSVLVDQAATAGLSSDQVIVRQKVLLYYEQKHEELETLKGQLQDQEDLRSSVSHDLEAGKNTFTEPTKKNLEAQIRNIGRSITQLEKKIKEASKPYEEATQLLRATPTYQAKWLEGYERKHGPIDAGAGTIRIREPELIMTDAPVDMEKHPEIPRQENTSANPAGSYRWLPDATVVPEAGCAYAYDDTDPLSKQHRIDVAKEVLLEYTHEPLRSYYKDKPYLTCAGYLSAQPGYKYLTLEITIHSERARQSFGSLVKGTALTIRLIDGNVLYLTTNNTDNGAVDLARRTTTYTSTYVLSKKAEKILSQSELDLIRVVWSTGYEDYDIYNLDFFIHQFNCLNQRF